MNIIFKILNNSKYFPFYIITPIPYAIGAAAGSILFGLMKANSLKKKLIVITPTIFQSLLKYNVCNKYLFNNLVFKNYNPKKYFFIRSIIKFFIEITFFLKRTFALVLKFTFRIRLAEHFFFPDIGIHESFAIRENKEDIDNISKIKGYNFSSKDNSIDLEKIYNIKSKKIFEKLGLEKNQEFVCLHVRENLYRHDKGRREVRNSNIYNYNELIEFLIKKNIYVFRLGKMSKNKITIKNKHIIDLPFLDIRRDFFDLYLLKNCKFLIGDDSGMTECAMMFNKDCLKTNITRLYEFGPVTKYSRTICKIPKYKGKKISIKDYLDMPYLQHHSFFKDEKKIDFEENSNEDLYNAIVEYFQVINGENSANLTKDQINFNNYIQKSFYKKYFSNDRDLHNHYRSFLLLKMQKSMKGSFCSFFLKKYF